MQDNISYDWLNLVEKALIKVEQLPALEEHFPFPWETAGHALQETLGLSLFKLSCNRLEWRDPHDLLKGMGDQPFVAAVEMAPIDGYCFFVLPQPDVHELVIHSLILAEDKESFLGPKLRQGFYYFLLLKAAQKMSSLNIFKDVSLHLLSTAVVPQENGLCIDIECALSSRTLHGRLICPQSFLTSFKSHQPLRKTTLLSLNPSPPLEILLRCEVGHTSISREELESLQVGDFLILDRCTFDPSEARGSLTITLGETPLFIARVKPEGIKILDYAFYQQPTSVTEDSNIKTAITSEIEEPIYLTAEVGQFNVLLPQLLQLQVGAFIEVPIQPQQKVDVMRNHQCIAKAELLKLGETTGLRILEIV